MPPLDIKGGVEEPLEDKSGMSDKHNRNTNCHEHYWM
jgi:hypothetical protein